MLAAYSYYWWCFARVKVGGWERNRAPSPVEDVGRESWLAWMVSQWFRGWCLVEATTFFNSCFALTISKSYKVSSENTS